MVNFCVSTARTPFIDPTFLKDAPVYAHGKLTSPSSIDPIRLGLEV